MSFTKHLFSSLFVLFFTLIATGQIEGDDLSNLEKARKLKFIEPDSAIVYFKKEINRSKEFKDTVSAINTLIELSDLYAHNVNYGESYDGYWEALLLADQSKDSLSIAKIYHDLGWLYSFYSRDKDGLKYFNESIKIHKKLADSSTVGKQLILSDYFSILSLYRVNEQYDEAKVYLDSCYTWRNKIENVEFPKFVEAEEGYLAATDGNFDLAIMKLTEAQLFFEEFDHTYLVVVYALLGDVYRMKGELDTCLEYYKMSLFLGENLKSHLNYRLIVYNALSEVYLSQQNFEEAFKYLKKAKDLDDQIFGIKSDNSQYLLEIKDKYRVEKERQEDLIEEQLIETLEHEDRIWFLQSIILVVTILFLVLYGVIFIKHLNSKHKNEKKILTEKQKLRLQKQNEVLELKNKELTEAALRLIEKDEFITNVKKKLSAQEGQIDVKTVKRILKSFQGSPTKNWTEFEARFTNINQSFYNNLRKSFPELSQTDQKICALVKLNFPSKDMARLLGISVESVHTSRYRLRRKLGLSRKDNLEDFISKF